MTGGAGASAPGRGKRRTGRLIDLEVLRAAAVSMVLFDHLSLLLPETFVWHYPGGLLARLNVGAGVDVFFCLSGFVVTRTLLAELAGLDRRQTRLELIGFWVRRAFRLWPTAWFWLLAAYVVSLTFNRLGLMNPAANLRNIVSGVGMFVNFANVYDLHHNRALGTMALYYTLSMEEQFYAVMPLLLLLRRRWVVMLLGGFMTYWVAADHDFWVRLAFRPGCLIAGVMLAFCEGGALWCRLERAPALQIRTVRAAACILLCLLASYVASLGPADDVFGLPVFRLQPVLLAVVCSVLVTGAALNPADRPGTRVQAMLAGLGGRSYVIYVVHPVAFAAAQEVVFRVWPAVLPGAVRAAVLLPLGAAFLLACTEVTLRCIERPLRLYGKHLVERREPVTSVAAA